MGTKEQPGFENEERLEKITGTVERIVFHAGNTGYTVARVSSDDGGKIVTVVGKLASLQSGERGIFEGKWVTNRKFGLQFQVERFRDLRPVSIEGIRKYLSSGMVKGIGPELTDRLVRAFGSETLDIIDTSPERLKEVEGIGKKRVDMILSGWKTQRRIRDVMVFLQSYGIGPQRAMKIYRMYGDESESILRKNPYKLAEDIHGIGFLTADGMAKSMGFPPDSPLRAEAALLHVLSEARESGHCYLPEDEMLKICREKLEVPEDSLQTGYQQLLEDGRLKKRAEAVYPSMFEYFEEMIARFLIVLLRSPRSSILMEPIIPMGEECAGFEPSPGQYQAIMTACREKVSIITGGPGVGKTTILKVLVKILGDAGYSTALCAPTGRAARRMAESVGREAKTIHRLLEYSPSTASFGYNMNKQLPVDYLIVDEMSMVDTQLFYHLLCALSSGSSLIMVGDVDQLPSVGPGQVLKDLIDSGTIPVSRLTEVHRQKEGSLIIRNAHRINRGLFPEIPPRSGPDGQLCDFYFIESKDPTEIREAIFRMVTERIPKRFNLDPLREVQVLSPMLKGELGVEALNRELRQVLNPGMNSLLGYSPGDRVMQIKNNYDKDIFNGDIGHVCGIDPDNQLVRVDFDGRMVEYESCDLEELKLAYACTIHKSQGSEFPAVVIPLYTGHYIMLQRNLIYTALTRARNLAVLVGTKKALYLAIKNNKVTARYTGLQEKLERFCSEIKL